MSAARVCAAPGCDRGVAHREGPGRPAIYCSPACRPSRSGGRSRGRAITVEVDADTADPAVARSSFLVRIRRGQRAVTVASDLGRFSAAALAEELRGLLGPAARQGGGTTE